MPDPGCTSIAFPKSRGFLLHEIALIGLGLATGLGLLFRAGLFNTVCLEITCCTLALVAFTAVFGATTPVRLKLRLAVAAAYVVWFYFAIARIAPLLAMPLRDQALLDIDVMALGATPAQWCASIATPALTDVLSLCYLSFLAYLCVAFLHALNSPWLYTLRCLQPILLAYAIGMACYLTLPAVGPARAFPELFPEELHGGLPFQFNQAVVGWGSSVFDVFPSLHILIAALLLAHDWRHCRRRFCVMTLPACGLVLSTVYLRYHYAVDLAAGLAIFLLLSFAGRRQLVGFVNEWYPRPVAHSP